MPSIGSVVSRRSVGRRTSSRILLAASRIAPKFLWGGSQMGVSSVAPREFLPRIHTMSDRLAAAARKPPAVGFVVRDLDHHDRSCSALLHYSVEHSPEVRQILDVQVRETVLLPETLWNCVFSHNLPV